MRSYLDFEGVYDASKRYIVRNWSDEDFTQDFGAENAYNDNKVIETKPAFSITIKAGEMRELNQFEAFTITKHFVDREMAKEAKKLEDRQLIERAEYGIGNPDVRKPYEEKTISEIKAGQETPFMEQLRETIRKEELAKIEAEKELPKEEVAPTVSEDIKADGEFSE